LMGRASAAPAAADRARREATTNNLAPKTHLKTPTKTPPKQNRPSST
jgi:hypothetical protein